MSTLPPGLTQKELDLYLRLDLAEKKIAPVKKTLNEKIKAAFPIKKATYNFEKVLVLIGVANTFEKEKFETDHPREQYPDFYTLVPATYVLDVKKLSDADKKGYLTPGAKLSVSAIEGDDNE